MQKLILASSSPRRKMLLEQLGLKFDIITSDIEEVVEPGLSHEEVVKSLAYQKAAAVAKELKDDHLVLGSDTIVVLEGKILGKPRDRQDAFAMLKSLSGRVNTVMTGVCIVNTLDGSYETDIDISYIKFRKIDDDEIWSYIDTGEPMDKAGSYGIQGLAAIFIEKIEGSHSGVMGLPVFLVDKMLKHFGVNVLGGNKY